VKLALGLGLALLSLSALPARAETIDVSDDHGGCVTEYAAR
jgi:hypothetical protein